MTLVESRRPWWGCSRGEHPQHNIEHFLINTHLESALQGWVNYTQLLMNSEIWMNSKNLHKGQHYTQAIWYVTAAAGQRQRAWSSWCQYTLLEAGFFQSLMPVARQGREHHKEHRAVRGVPRGQGNAARRLPWLEKVRVNFPRQKITCRGTWARLAEQMQSAHSLWPLCSVQERKGRTGAAHYSMNPKFPFEPSLLPSSHVNAVPQSLHHHQRITKGPPAYLSKYKLDVSFFLSCLESQEAPATKHYPDVQTARLCQSPRVRAKVKICLQSTSSSIRMTNASQRCHNMHWCNEFWGAGRRTVRGGAAEEGFIGKPASYFSTIYHTTFTLWVCLFLQLQRWKVTQLQHELSQPRKRKAAFSAPQGILCLFVNIFWCVEEQTSRKECGHLLSEPKSTMLERAERV